MVIFLCKMKSSNEHMEKLKSQLRFDFVFTVSSSARFGGLCAMWKKEAKISLCSFSSKHIDLEVGGVGEVFHWRLTFFYGYLVEAERYKSWELLQRLKETSSLPWCCLGDFNEILQTVEQERVMFEARDKWKDSGML